MTLILDYFLYNGEPIIEYRLDYLNNFVDCYKSDAVAVVAVAVDCCNLSTSYFADYSSFVADYSIELLKVVVVNLICDDDADYCTLNYCNCNCNCNLCSNCY